MCKQCQPNTFWFVSQMTSGITYQSLSNLISNFDFCSDMNISQDQNWSFFIEYNSLESTFSFFLLSSFYWFQDITKLHLCNIPS